MALKGKIYSIARQHDDLNTNELFQSMIDKSAAQDTIVMDGRNLAAGSIFAEQIHANAITADKIKAGAIQTDHMLAGTIDVDRLKASQLILPGKNYGGVVINNNGLTMKSTGTAKLDIKLSSESGFNITDGNNNQLIDIDPKTGNVKMQVNQMTIGGYSATTTKDIDNIEVGGRNLLKGTSDSFKEINPRTRFTSLPENSITPISEYGLKAGDTVTFRMYIQAHNSVPANARITYYPVGSSSYGNVVGNRIQAGEEGYSTVTYTIPSNIDRLEVALDAPVPAGNTSILMYYKEPKLEKGNKATGWTSAPEDVEDSYTAIAEAKANLAETQSKAYADGVVDNIEVGGRNLLYSDRLLSNYDFSTIIERIPETGTFVIEMKATNRLLLAIEGQNDESMKGIQTISGYMTINGTPINENTLQRISTHFPTISKRIDETNGYFEFTLNRNRDVNYYIHSWEAIDVSIGDIVRIDYFQIERGNKSTDWTPAQEDVENSYTAVAEEKASGAETRAKTHADGKAETAETNAKDYAKKQVDDLEVGGRNYFLKPTLELYRNSSSNIHDDGSVEMVFVSGNANYTGLWPRKEALRPVVSNKYTLSYGTLENRNIRALFFIYEDKNMTIPVTTGVKNAGVYHSLSYHAWYKDNFPRSGATIELPDNAKYITVGFQNTDSSNPRTTLEWVKLEKGTKATDWTPAPEDVQAEIDSRPTFQDFDKTDKVTINGGNIKAGTISSEKNYSWIDLDKGHFSFGDKRLVWDGSKMTVKAESIDLSGKVTFSDFNTSLKNTVNSKVTQLDVDKSIDRIEIGGRNLILNTSFEDPSRLPSIYSDASIGVIEHSYNFLIYEISNFGVTNLVFTFSKHLERNTEYVLSFSLYSPYDMFLHDISLRDGATNESMGNNCLFLPSQEIIGGKEYNEIEIVFQTDNFGVMPNGLSIGGSAPLTTEVVILNVKLEKGNKPTNWTPAPEDVQENINDVGIVANDVRNKTDSWTYSGETTIDGGAIQADTITAAQIVANSITSDLIEVDEISALTSKLGDVTAGSITSENGNLHIDLNEGFMEVADGMFKIHGKDVADKESLGQVEEKIKQEVEYREGFISFDDGIVTIGQKNSPTNIQIKNDRISFMQNGTEVAYITEQTMEITHGIFVETAKIGEHKQQTLSGGHTVFTWEGR